ncbi:putative ABC transporter B family member 25-like [Capsicum annuum]|nr:putative ABC transporter B family member 25-like [Capsicum annuum]
MSSGEKLTIFLNILAHHEKNQSIKFDYIRLGWSVSQSFNECLCAILKLTPFLLVNPKPVVGDETEDRWKWFEGCLGALDGTYIPIRVPTQYKPRYRTRKGEIATNVLGVCDRNLNFTYALPGWEGSAADGRVLRDAIVRRNGLKILEGNYYLCDGGYTNGKGFLTPYRGYRYWLKDWQCDNPSPRCKEELFNMRHSRARNVIERAFGLLKGFWGILRSPSWYSVKAEPKDKNMNTKKWPMFEDWEEIFDKDRATGEFAEAPLDTTKEIQKSLTPQFCNDMSLGFPIDVDDEEEDGAYHSSKVDIGEAENATGHSAFTTAEDATKPSSFSGAENATGPSVFTEGENLTGASAGTSENENAGSQQTHKQGENAKRSSSNVNEKEKNKKRKKKIAEDDNKTFLKGMMEVLKNFTESQNKRIGALIEKLGERDRSDVCGQIYSILKSPVFLELYTVEQCIKAAMVLCKDDKKMELFLSMSEDERDTIMWMTVHDEL